MFDDFSKRSKAVRAALDLAEKRGWGDISLADIAQARQSRPRRSPARVHLQERHPPRLPGGGRRRGAGQGPRRRRGAKPARPAVRSHHDALRAMQPYKAGAQAHLRRICAAGPARPSALLCGSLASQYWMLAGAGAKLDGPAARSASPGSPQSTARCFRSGSTTIRRRSTRPWPRSTSGSANGERMLSRHRDGMQRCLPLRLRIPAARWKRGEPPEAPPLLHRRQPSAAPA